MNVFLVKAGKIRLEQIGVAVVTDIGGEGNTVFTEQTEFEIAQLAEGIKKIE